MEETRELDDPALQFDRTEARLQFISAWKQADLIVDAGYDIPTSATPLRPERTPDT